MAVLYVRSTDGNDADNGSTWTLAKATLAGAMAVAAPGDTIYVSNNHAEVSTDVITLPAVGTATNFVKIICVNDSAEPPTTQATTATVSSGPGFAINIVPGYVYIDGVTIIAGSGTTFSSDISLLNSTASGCWIIVNGGLVLGAANSGSDFIFGQVGANPQKVKLVNSTLTYSHAGNRTILRAELELKRCTIGGTVPTVWLTPVGGDVKMGAMVRGCDLSAFGSGKSLVNPSGACGNYQFVDCKLGSAVSVLSTAIPGPGGATVRVENGDSADTNYRMDHYNYQGSIKSETAKVRSGGASDGTTAISWNMTSLAGASFISPLESPPLRPVWNTTTGSAVTLTVEIAQNNAGTALKESEVWLEVEYLGTSGYPVSSFANDNNSTVLTASTTDQTTSSVTWNNMTNPTKQKLSVTVTPQEVGWIIPRVMLAKASTTVYVDPIATVS
jgi:hypothetical protein